MAFEKTSFVAINPRTLSEEEETTQFIVVIIAAIRGEIQEWSVVAVKDEIQIRDLEKKDKRKKRG